jgi:hypothetical protein
VLSADAAVVTGKATVNLSAQRISLNDNWGRVYAAGAVGGPLGVALGQVQGNTVDEQEVCARGFYYGCQDKFSLYATGAADLSTSAPGFWSQLKARQLGSSFCRRPRHNPPTSRCLGLGFCSRGCVSSVHSCGFSFATGNGPAQSTPSTPAVCLLCACCARSPAGLA